MLKQIFKITPHETLTSVFPKISLKIFSLFFQAGLPQFEESGAITIYRIFKKIVWVIFSCSYCTPSRSIIILASRRRTRRKE